MSTSFNNITSSGKLLINVKTYLWLLHLKFAKVLISFYSLCNKLFKRRWDKLVGRQSFMCSLAFKQLRTSICSLPSSGVLGQIDGFKKILSYTVSTYV